MFLSENVILLLCLAVSSALHLGDKCIDDYSGLNGTCQYPQVCKFALKYHKLPKSCEDGSYCCPPVKLRRSEILCQRFFVTNEFTRVSGIPASLREFPHMAAIGFSQNYRIIWGCGGSIIHSRFILSAAHCVKDKDLGPAKWVRIGDLDLVNTTEGANPRDLRIAKPFVHPDYISPSHYNDIAIFKLEKEIFFNKDYHPACLHVSQNLPKLLEAPGWGRTGYLEDPSSHLLKAQLHVVKYKQCAKRYRNHRHSRKLKEGVKDKIQICAGNNPGNDTCLGDSGGPLHFKNGQFLKMRPHFVVVGITSFGKACGLGNSVSVYTRVSAYLDWIEDIVWPVRKN